jgi:recombination protein RecA
VIGNRTRVKVVKDKVAPPFKEVEFDIMYGHGISREGDVLDLASAENIVDKSGTWFSFGGERIGQGREQAKAFLREHPEILQQVEGKLFEKFGIRRGPVAVPPPVPEEEPHEEKRKARGK